MTNFTGTFDCKVDTKGRILLPTTFRRQIGEVETYCFVIKKDLYEQCLELYTIEAWEELNRNIKKVIKPFNREHRQLERDFRNGATEVECDPSGRLLIPGRLLKQVEITNDALLSGHYGKIEIWSPNLYYNSGGDEKARQERFETIIGEVTL